MSKVRTGVVISTNMDKSIVVRVDRMVAHKLYGKRYRVSNKFLAHDANNEAQVGDIAVIQETKPISKRKSWLLVSRRPGSDITARPEPSQELAEEKA